MQSKQPALGDQTAPQKLCIQFKHAWKLVQRGKPLKVQIECQVTPGKDRYDTVGCHYTLDGWNTVIKTEGTPVEGKDGEWLVDIPLCQVGGDDDDLCMASNQKIWFALCVVRPLFSSSLSAWDNNNGWNYEIELDRLPTKQIAV